VSTASGVHWSVSSPTYTGPVEQIATQLGGIVSGIAGFLRGKPSPAEKIGYAHDIAAGVFAATPLGPFIALEGAVVSTVGKLYEKERAREKLRRIKHRATAAYAYQMNKGHAALYGARYALARVGIDPESVAPLAPPPVATTMPSWHQEVVGTKRDARGRLMPVYQIVPHEVTGFVQPVDASQPYYNPETRSVETERGILIRYGEGPGAEAERERYSAEIFGELSRRPFPGRGLVPSVFARLRR